MAPSGCSDHTSVPSRGGSWVFAASLLSGATGTLQHRCLTSVLNRSPKVDASSPLQSEHPSETPSSLSLFSQQHLQLPHPLCCSCLRWRKPTLQQVHCKCCSNHLPGSGKKRSRAQFYFRKGPTSWERRSRWWEGNNCHRECGDMLALRAGQRKGKAVGQNMSPHGR